MPELWDLEEKIDWEQKTNKEGFLLFFFYMLPVLSVSLEESFKKMEHSL